MGKKPAENAAKNSDRSDVRATSVLGSTRLRFERDRDQCSLVVEAPVCDDVLPELYRLLFSCGAQVIRVHAQVLGERTLHELHVVGFDGTVLDEVTWETVQIAIFEHLGARLAEAGPELRFTRPGRRASSGRISR